MSILPIDIDPGTSASMIRPASATPAMQGAPATRSSFMTHNSGIKNSGSQVYDRLAKRRDANTDRRQYLQDQARIRGQKLEDDVVNRNQNIDDLDRTRIETLADGERRREETLTDEKRKIKQDEVIRDEQREFDEPIRKLKLEEYRDAKAKNDFEAKKAKADALLNTQKAYAKLVTDKENNTNNSDHAKILQAELLSMSKEREGLNDKLYHNIIVRVGQVRQTGDDEETINNAVDTIFPGKEWEDLTNEERFRVAESLARIANADSGLGSTLMTSVNAALTDSLSERTRLNERIDEYVKLKGALPRLNSNKALDAMMQILEKDMEGTEDFFKPAQPQAQTSITPPSVKRDYGSWVDQKGLEPVEETELVNILQRDGVIDSNLSPEEEIEQLNNVPEHILNSALATLTGKNEVDKSRIAVENANENVDDANDTEGPLEKTGEFVAKQAGNVIKGVGQLDDNTKENLAITGTSIVAPLAAQQFIDEDSTTKKVARSVKESAVKTGENIKNKFTPANELRPKINATDFGSTTINPNKPVDPSLNNKIKSAEQALRDAEKAFNNQPRATRTGSRNISQLRAKVEALKLQQAGTPGQSQGPINDPMKSTQKMASDLDALAEKHGLPKFKDPVPSDPKKIEDWKKAANAHYQENIKDGWKRIKATVSNKYGSQGRIGKTLTYISGGFIAAEVVTHLIDLFKGDEDIVAAVKAQKQAQDDFRMSIQDQMKTVMDHMEQLKKLKASRNAKSPQNLIKPQP